MAPLAIGLERQDGNRALVLLMLGAILSKLRTVVTNRRQAIAAVRLRADSIKPPRTTATNISAGTSPIRCP